MGLASDGDCSEVVVASDGHCSEVGLVVVRWVLNLMDTVVR